MSLKSIGARVYDVLLFEGEFTPQGETASLKYTQLVLPITVNGDDVEVRIRLSRDQANVLKAAQKIDTDKTLFDDDEESVEKTKK